MQPPILPNWMRQTLGILLIIFFVLLILNQADHLNHSAQTLSVSATGKVTVVPDVATVTLGVISQGATPVDVKNANNAKMNQVIAFIKEQNIAAEEIQTTGFYAQPQYRYANGQNTIVGYQADQTITVKIKKINESQAQLEKILDGAVLRGANEVRGVTFSIEDADELKEEAREKAIKEARKKAKQLAAAAGLSLGKTVNVIETGDSNNYPVPMAADVANFSARAKSVPANIEPGKQEISETVTLVFQILPF